jgi:CrcB protein
MLNAASVIFGGAFGALLRFLISEIFPLNKLGIPLTIIIVNFAGCFFMGAADGIFEKISAPNHYKYFLTVGLLGGFTTFSTFSLEFANLIRNGHFLNGAIYVIVSVFAALIGFWLGYSLIKTV